MFILLLLVIDLVSGLQRDRKKSRPLQDERSFMLAFIIVFIMLSLLANQK
jgi:hypothetical protein